MSSQPSRTSAGTADMLPAERAKASFSVERLQEVVGRKRGELTSQFAPLFEDPVFDSTLDDYRSYEEKFDVKMRRACTAMQIIRDNPKLMGAHKAQKVGMKDFFETGTMGIHFLAFLPYLQTNASAEQKDEWLDGALNGRYWAAYAQTELGHGSNLRGLETTVTFDKATDEFVINSPTLTSMKWWPTGIYQCTHGVVFGQLIIDGKNHGVFGFFCQFRKPDGTLMPGVEVGEMGPKLDPNDVGIGYARFDHVRVPRFNMFQKNAQVTREGEFIPAPPKLSKFGYVGMMTIRVGLVNGAASVLMSASTIAVRYSAVRHQGFKDTTAEDPISTGEHPILDYKIQQYRIFKALGLGLLFVFTARQIREFLKRVVAGVGRGDESAADDLPELHATCGGLKAVCCAMAHAGAEDCRKACGGQGYLRSSGVADLSVWYSGAVTAEGEQMLLGLQTGRYLIKMMGEVNAGKPEALSSAVKYLAEAPLEPIKLNSYRGQLETIVSLHRDRARRVVVDLEADFKEAMQSGLSFDDALNSCAVLAYHATECHCIYVMARNTMEALHDREQVKDDAVRAALLRVFELTLLQQIRENGTDFASVLDAKQQRLVLKSINELLDEIRPDAVALVDGFNLSDASLKSTLGRFDGNVYEAIYEEGKLNPLNNPEKPMVGWEHFAPILDMDFMQKGMDIQRQGAVATAKL